MEISAIVTVKLWCSDCSSWTWHVHTSTGQLVCLQCRLADRKGVKPCS